MKVPFPSLVFHNKQEAEIPSGNQTRRELVTDTEDIHTTWAMWAAL